MAALTIDIGGTKISAGLVAENYSVFNYLKCKTPKNSKDFFSLVSEIIKKYGKDYNFQKIGIGCAGIVDQRGTVAKSPNLPFLNGINLTDSLSSKIEEKIKKNRNSDFQITTRNDAVCFTLAEAVCGAGKDYKIVLGITIGTGLGGGIVTDKKIFSGSQGFAGEFGHTIIDINYTEQCACGNYGCLEQFVSGKAAEKYYQEISGKEKSALEIEKLSYKGDADALAALDKMAKYLGAGLANIVHILNPDAIVIGGGMGKTKTLFEPAIKYMRYHLLSEKIRIKVFPSQLKDEAVLIGAALL